MAAAQFQLSFTGGGPFVLPTPELLAEVEDYLRISERHLITTPGHPWPGVFGGQLGAPRPVCPPEVKLYELYVPTGASNWSVFRGLMHKDEALKLEPGLFGTLTLRHGAAGTGVAASMFCLPPVPLTGINGASDLYLITLVDTRYRWQLQAYPNTLNNVNSTDYWGSSTYTWKDFVGGNVVGWLTFAPDGVSAAEADSAYGLPEIDSDLFSWGNVSRGAMYDAAFASVGMVLTKDVAFTPSRPGGTLGEMIALKWSAANTFAATARVNAAADRSAGGVLYTAQYGYTLPFSVTVVFPRWVNGFGFENYAGFATTHRPHGGSRNWGRTWAVNKTAGDFGLSSSAMSTDTQWVISSTAKAHYDQLQMAFNAAPNNSTALTNLATLLAGDFYAAAQQNVCETYDGIVPFDCRAALNVVYSYYPTPMTRVWRRPMNEWVSHTFHNLDGTKSPTFLGKPKGGETAVLKYSGATMVRVNTIHSNPASWTDGESVAYVDPNGSTPSSGRYYLGYLAHAYDGTEDYWVIAGQIQTSPLPVSQGGTGQSTLTSGAVLAGNGTSPVDSVLNTRVSGEDLEFKLASDSWVGFGEASF